MDQMPFGTLYSTMNSDAPAGAEAPALLPDTISQATLCCASISASRLRERVGDELTLIGSSRFLVSTWGFPALGTIDLQ